MIRILLVEVEKMLQVLDTSPDGRRPAHSVLGLTLRFTPHSRFVSLLLLHSAERSELTLYIFYVSPLPFIQSAIGLVV
jgi:hypothetical protein